MKLFEVIQKLENCWDCDGFLDQIRRGVFDPLEGEEFQDILRSIDIAEESMVPKRLLSLMWYLPSFLEWQKERVAENGKGEEYERFVTEIQNMLEEILGVP